MARAVVCAQAAVAFGAVGWPIVVKGVGEIAEMAKAAEKDLTKEFGEFKAAISKFFGVLKSCQLSKLGGAVSDLGKEAVGLPLALAGAIHPAKVVAIGVGVLSGVLSSVATVTCARRRASARSDSYTSQWFGRQRPDATRRLDRNDAAARLTVALAISQGLGERAHAAVAAPLKLVEVAADVAKPTSGEAVAAYAKLAIKGASLTAALAFVDANGALVKRLQPALVGAGLVLHLAGSKSAALEYGLAAVACYFQTKVLPTLVI